MGRATVNPLGGPFTVTTALVSRAFYNLAYSQNCTPDSNKSNSTCGHIRAAAAALAHYTAQSWGIIAEWDYGPQCFQTPATCTRASGTVRCKSVYPVWVAVFYRMESYGGRHS